MGTPMPPPPAAPRPPLRERTDDAQEIELLAYFRRLSTTERASVLKFARVMATPG